MKKIVWILVLIATGLIGWFVGLWAAPLLPAVLLAYTAGALCSYRSNPKKVRYGQVLVLIIIAAVVGSMVYSPEASVGMGLAVFAMWMFYIVSTAISFSLGWSGRRSISSFQERVLL